MEAVEQRGIGKSEAARTFGVSLASVKRYVGKARQGSSLSPKKHPGLRPKLEMSALGGCWRQTWRTDPP